MKRRLLGSTSQRSFRRFLLIAILALVLVAIGVLVSNVRQQLRDLETASSDNVQYYLSQIQVEHLIFLTEAHRFSQTTDGDLFELKKRFDIFYSRVKTVGTSQLYAELSKQTDIEGNIAQLNNYLEATAEIIDSGPERLRENIAQVVSDGELALTSSREFALAGISYYSKKRDEQRQSIYDSLLAITLLSVMLFIVLVVALYFLSRLNAVNRDRSKQLGEANQQLSVIVSASLDAIIAVDRVGNIREFNGAAEKIFGYTRDEVFGRQLDEFIIPERFRHAHAEGMKRYRDSGNLTVTGAGRLRLEAMRKSGEHFPIELNIERTQGPSGDIFVSFLRDISKRVADEEELKVARDAALAGEKSKSDFLAIMSHEMRTPLNGLLGTLQLLESTELDKKQRRYLEIMNNSGNQLMTHVNDVLDITRLEAGRFEFSESVFDLNSSLRKLLDSQQASAEEAGNRLIYNSDPNDENLVVADEIRLQQIMLNLVGNAIKFTRNGTITVETENLGQDGLVEIRVIDSGIGIAADRLETVFEDFQTLDSSFGRVSGGTGLGLGIARRITEGMGGSIGVESEVGEGTLFWIRLPIRTVEIGDREAPAKSVQNLLPSAVKPMRILIVEDNEINREIAREFLEKDHHHIVEAHNGQDGVDMAARETFDLILMDISMPELDGVDATRAIRRSDGPNKLTPIIALTAHVQAADEERFLAAGMTDVVHKPLKRRTLNATIVKHQGIHAPIFPQGRTDGLLDAVVIDELRSELGDEKYHTLFRKFVVKIDEELSELQASGQTFETRVLADKLHSAAGPVAMFGASALHTHIQKMERAARAGEVVDIPRATAKLIQLWQETKQALTTYVSD